MTQFQRDDPGGMPGTGRAGKAAKQIVRLLADVFRNDPEWQHGHSLRFLLNGALFDVLAVLNAPDSLASPHGADASRYKEYASKADRFRGDFLAMCESLRRIVLEPLKEGEPRVYESGLSCLDCGEAIVEREPVWTVNVNYEVFDRGTVEVLYSITALAFCEACAAKRDFNRIRVSEKHRGPGKEAQ